MKELAEMLLAGAMLVSWIFGIAIASKSSFWLAVACFFLPPLAWIQCALEVLR